LKAPVTVPIASLKMEPYASVLCYPKVKEDELQSRLEELNEHGVEAVSFAGETSAFNVPVLGKGFVGIVVTAHLGEQKAALKIRRVDADRMGLQHEAQMLAKANSVGIGPRLISVSKNFLLMQLIDGALLPNWLASHKKAGEIRGVLNEILEQCWRLDNISLDHGELSNAPKHIILDKHQKPWIVDFETASFDRKPANVTSICHFLFISYSVVAKAVLEVLGKKNSEEIICALRLYKNERTRENFNRLSRVCLA